MRIVSIDHLKPGQILGQTIYGEDGTVLLRKGVYFSEFIIERLKNSGYPQVYIWDDHMEYEIEDVIRPEIRQKAINDLRKFTLAVKKGDIKQIEGNIDVLRAMASTIVEDLFSEKNIVVELVDLKNLNRGLYQHSVNVMIHSVIMGISLGLSQGEVRKLAVAALLHDIGLVFIPSEILLKESALTPEEYKLAKEHPKKGFDFLKEKLNLEATIRMGVLDHHEHYDGGGYPEGKKGDQIHLYGRIIAVANKYDSIISDRLYKKGLPVSEALEYIMGSGGSVLDPKLTQHFLKHINPYPMNTLVELNDGRVAGVIKVHEHFYARPVVRIIKGENKGEEVDLLQRQNLVISKVL